MSQISVEKKLELIRLIRSQEDRNKELIRNREALLYGKSDIRNPYISTSAYREEGHVSKGSLSGFKIRFCLSAILVGTVFCLEFFQIEASQKPLTTLYSEIKKDVLFHFDAFSKEGNLFDFVKNITYTLEDD